MKITIKGINLVVTEALDQHTRKKIDKIATRIESMTSIEVILKVKDHQSIAEATLHFPQHTIFAEADDQDMYHAIDLMSKKLLTQVDKYKSKLNDHHIKHDQTRGE
jgi:putative sigma-54 modulation protein